MSGPAVDVEWVDACAVDDVEADDVARFDRGEATYAIYRTEDERWFATDGLCTHQRVHLADGLLVDGVIECPKHNGRFDVTTGAALCAPVRVDLVTYPVRVEGDRVWLGLPRADGDPA